jgi:hypothetical protein
VKFINSALCPSKFLHVLFKQILLHEKRILNCRGLYCEVHKLSIMSVKIISYFIQIEFTIGLYVSERDYHTRKTMIGCNFYMFSLKLICMLLQATSTCSISVSCYTINETFSVNFGNFH